MFEIGRNLLWIGSIFAVLGCGPQVDAQEPAPVAATSLPGAAKEIANLVRTEKLDDLALWVEGAGITYDPGGQMDPGIRCFLVGGASCPLNSGKVREILSGRTFTYFHHVDDDTVVVSYIREGARPAFNASPQTFLPERYLEDYVSCLLVRIEGRWRLQESIFFAETEGPFSPEPDV
ncbi:hypothetical protein [Brevundimonas kwangchunensis]